MPIKTKIMQDFALPLGSDSFRHCMCENEDRDLSIRKVCSRVREIVEMSIIKSLRSLHYNEQSVQPVMCFRCEHCSELHRVKEGKKYHRTTVMQLAPILAFHCREDAGTMKVKNS